MDPDLAKKILRTIKAAKGSHIVRVDVDGSPLRTEPTEEELVELARPSDPGLRVGGLAFGRCTVAWDGRRFRATSAMIFPAMRINREKARAASPSSCHVIAIGDNEFRFLSE